MVRQMQFPPMKYQLEAYFINIFTSRKASSYSLGYRDKSRTKVEEELKKSDRAASSDESHKIKASQPPYHCLTVSLVEGKKPTYNSTLAASRRHV